MKKFLVAGIAAAAFCGAPAIAADMPTKGPVYKAAPAPVFSWTGCYIGGQVGYGWGSARENFSNGAPTDNSDPRGWLGGGHLGCNYQVNNFVLGIEGDYEGADLHGSFSNSSGITSIGSAKMKSDGSVRGRIGVAWDRSLFYLTGGWATARYSLTGGPVGGPADLVTASPNGWTIGAGWEYAFANNWSGRIEYRHTDYGTSRGQLLPDFPGVFISVHDKTDVVRVGLTYRFGGDPWGKSPVVAKY